VTVSVNGHGHAGQEKSTKALKTLEYAPTFLLHHALAPLLHISRSKVFGNLE